MTKKGGKAHLHVLNFPSKNPTRFSAPRRKRILASYLSGSPSRRLQGAAAPSNPGRFYPCRDRLPCKQKGRNLPTQINNPPCEILIDSPLFVVPRSRVMIGKADAKRPWPGRAKEKFSTQDFTWWVVRLPPKPGTHWGGFRRNPLMGNPHFWRRAV